MLAVELNEEKPLKLDEQIQRTRRLKIFVEPSICMKLSSQTTKHEQDELYIQSQTWTDHPVVSRL